MAVILAAALWALLGIVCIILGYVFAFLHGNPDGRMLKKAKQGLLCGGYLYSLWKRKMLRKLQLSKREEQYYRAIYVNEDPLLSRLMRECRQGLIVFGCSVAFAAVMAALSAGGAFSDTKINAFQRPASGTETVQLRVMMDRKSYDMEYTVRERTFSEEEVKAAWEKAKRELPEQILAKNLCADEITGNLYLPKKLAGTNVELVWMSSNYRIVDYEGKVNTANAAPDGSIVTITVQLKYGTLTEFLDIPVRVLRESPEEKSAGERLYEELERRDADQVYDPIMELPTDVGDARVTFYRKKSRTPWLFAVLFLLLLGGLFCMWGSEEKRMRQEREDQLLKDYPDLVSKITLLMQAGLTLRSAWDRITEDYLSARDKKKTRYVYEEMRNVRNKLNAGIPEAAAYEEFGRNCGNIRYLRLSSVLVQNLKKGTGGLVPLLRKEAAEAFAERKERVKQKGEEAGTRLLIPMAGILVLILAIIMIPAFLSF